MKWLSHSDRSAPARALGISALALSVPAVAFASGYGTAARFEAFLWISVLVPAVLLAYYRGWKATTTGLILGVLCLSAAQLYMLISVQRLPSPPYVVAFVGALVFLSWLAETVGGRWWGEARGSLARSGPVSDVRGGSPG